MSDNQWLAIDAVTPPFELARQMRESWEQFLTDRTVAAVRGPIAASWKRSQAAGVDPRARRVAPTLKEREEVMDDWPAHSLAKAAPLIRECLGAVSEASEHLLVVSDAQGMLLWIEGDERIRRDAAEEMNFAVGASWSESDAGTNAIGTALAAEHAVQVFASEHFNEVVQHWTCAAAPIRDADTGEVLGVIDLTGRTNGVHPHNFASAVATAHAVEAQLRAELAERHSELRARYGELVNGRGRRALVTATGRIVAASPEGWPQSTRLVIPPGGGEVSLPHGGRVFAEPVGREQGYIVRAVEGGRAGRHRHVLKLELLGQDRPMVELDGRSVRLTRRHAEILALLTLGGGSMTSEELAADLYGDDGQPAAARVEVSRLRKVLRGEIDPQSYRLTVDIESDVAVVRSLLDRGEVRAAAERYRDPILPRSEAPGVVREREALDTWVRHAALTSGDPDAIWAWVQSASGRDDLPAWKRLVAQLTFTDPRRAHAAARVTWLRARFAAPDAAAA